MNEIIDNEQVKDKIITVREQQVILDSDVAELYGVETRHINQAVSNNPEKFPAGYIIDIELEEWKNLKSKILMSSWGGKNSPPKAFTEKGLYMLATILKSPQAVQTTLAIVETFAQLKELARTVSQLSSAKSEEERESLIKKGGKIIVDVLNEDITMSDTDIDDTDLDIDDLDDLDDIDLDDIDDLDDTDTDLDDIDTDTDLDDTDDLDLNIDDTDTDTDLDDLDDTDTDDTDDTDADTDTDADIDTDADTDTDTGINQLILVRLFKILNTETETETETEASY
jgi:hypothetical protein